MCDAGSAPSLHCGSAWCHKPAGPRKADSISLLPVQRLVTAFNGYRLLAAQRVRNAAIQAAEMRQRARQARTARAPCQSPVCLCRPATGARGSQQAHLTRACVPQLEADASRLDAETAQWVCSRRVEAMQQARQSGDVAAALKASSAAADKAAAAVKKAEKLLWLKKAKPEERFAHAVPVVKERGMVRIALRCQCPPCLHAAYSRLTQLPCAVPNTPHPEGKLRSDEIREGCGAGRK